MKVLFSRTPSIASAFRFTARSLKTVIAVMTAVAVTACGGGGAGSTGSSANSGPNKTSLRVEASDADGDALQYQWRVTGGSIENRNSRETVWTMPDGQGLHFAYVMISDRKGGYVEQQCLIQKHIINSTYGRIRGEVSPCNQLSAN